MEKTQGKGEKVLEESLNHELLKRLEKETIEPGIRKRTIVKSPKESVMLNIRTDYSERYSVVNSCRVCHFLLDYWGISIKEKVFKTP